jgi:hypothetical protein
MGAETQRSRAADPAAAVISLDEKIAVEDTNTARNPQAAAKRRCPGCARKCTKFVYVDGWHAGRATLLCKRCAAGLIIVRGRAVGLKLAPEGRS